MHINRGMRVLSNVKHSGYCSNNSLYFSDPIVCLSNSEICCKYIHFLIAHKCLNTNGTNERKNAGRLDQPQYVLGT